MNATDQHTIDQSTVKEERKAAYCDYLQGFRWDYMATITFRGVRRDSIHAVKQVYSTLRETGFVNRAFLISEPHTTGFIHYHGLLFDGKPRTDRECTAIARYLKAGVSNEFGFSHVNKIRDMRAVTGYCTKYVLKGLEDDAVDYQFLGNWNIGLV